MGYLAQHQDLMSGNTIYEEVRTAKSEIIEMERQIRALELEISTLTGDALQMKLDTYHRLTAAFERADGYSYKSELVGVLKGLGFTEDEFQKPVDALSGGQKTRVSLGKLLLTKPDILLLDEPTNHLDMNSIFHLAAVSHGNTFGNLFNSFNKSFANLFLKGTKSSLKNGTLRNYIRYIACSKLADCKNSFFRSADLTCDQ